ncbi:MAG: hypothetical protein U0168_26895 [Nannocystaceae bacterium]
MAREHSGLAALSELRAMEAARVAAAEQTRLQQAEAVAAQQHAAQQAAAAAQAERARQQQAWQQWHTAQAERHALEERIRIETAAAAARAEQEARLRQEQARLQASLAQAERAARPRWPLVAVPVLLCTTAIAAVLAFVAGEPRSELDRTPDAYEQQVAALHAKLDRLAAEQARLQQERDAIAARIDAAASAAERDALAAQLAELDRKLATPSPGTTPSDRKRVRKPGPRPTTTTPAVREDKPATSTRKPIVVDGSDPLSGLE